jgi:hypothetical protein
MTIQECSSTMARLTVLKWTLADMNPMKLDVCGRGSSFLCGKGMDCSPKTSSKSKKVGYDSGEKDQGVRRRK